jgi:hypothetical protein
VPMLAALFHAPCWPERAAKIAKIKTSSICDVEHCDAETESRRGLGIICRARLSSFPDSLGNESDWRSWSPADISESGIRGRPQ